MAMNADGIKTENAWQSRATELAAFTLKRFAVRNDVCGVYSDDGQSSTKHLGGGDDQLRNILQQHFAGTQVCGLHSQNADWQTRWFAVDLDCKEWYPDREERAWRNKTYAYLLKDRLESRGFNVLIESSNGIGGFHVWVLLDGYVPAAWVHHLLREIVSDAEDCGFGKFLDANDKKQNDLPEVFPKKDRPSKDRIGNWLRFPGRHHRLKKHWSYFLDDDGLAMTFEDSAYAWLKFPESDASLVPEYVLPEIPKPEPRKIPANAGGVDGCRAAAESFIDAMNWDELLTSFGWQDCGGGKWRRPGKPEGSNSAILNDVGLHVFSSAVDNLKAEETYGRWRFYVCSQGYLMEGLGQIEAARELLGRAKADEIDKASQRAYAKQNEARQPAVNLSALLSPNEITNDVDEAWICFTAVDEAELQAVNIVEAVARSKKMPVDSFRAFGAHIDHRGQLEVARVPMFDAKLQPCSNFDLALISPDFEKGMSEKGKPVGLFVTMGNPPTDGDEVLVTEGVKDAAALHGLGFKAVGTPGSKLAAKFARVFAGCRVVLIPDRDTTGEDSAPITAARLKGIAASVRIATLPGELKARNGDGVREVLAMKDGESMLRQAIEDARPWEPEADEGPPDDASEWTSLKFAQGLTDRSNSRRFLKAYGDRVRFVFAWGKWLVWDGSRWQIDDGGAVLRLAMAVADSVWMDAKDFMTKDVVDFAVSTSGHGKLTSMLKLAAADVAVAVGELDTNPWLLNCPNGTVDLRTGKLRPHRREDLITKICQTNYNPEASSYCWDRFLESVFDGHAPTIEFLQRFAGYCLTGDVSEQVLGVAWGVGSNGKSTFLNALQTTLGTDYTSAAPPSLLMEKKTETHPTELAGLFGKRLVIAQESNAGAKLAEATVKQLTGGDIISARRMKEDFWTFAPSHKLIMATNHKPRIRGTDHAIWRRLLLIPFTQKFWNPAKGETGPDELKQDKGLSAKLATECEGILAWAVRGCLEWQRGGLQIPDSIRAATEFYRSEQDILGRFVDECCLVGPVYKVKFSVLFTSLETWCNESGDNLPSRTFVGQWLKDNEYQDKHSGSRWYLGIELKTHYG